MSAATSSVVASFASSPWRVTTPRLAVTVIGPTDVCTGALDMEQMQIGALATGIYDRGAVAGLVPRGRLGSVMHDSAFIADILSTALYVMGPYAGRDWARAHNISAIFITDQNEVLTSVPMPSLKVLDAKFTVKN